MVKTTAGCVLLAMLATCVDLRAGADSQPAAPEVRLLIVQDGNYGYIDRTGKVVIPPRFGYALGFSDGMARVRVGQEWTYIDLTGKMLDVRFPPPFRFQDGQYYFAEGLAVCRVGGKEQRTPDGYHTDIVGGKYGYIDHSGAKVIPVEFDAAGRFSQGLAAVSKQGKWGYIEKTGRMAIPPQFDAAEEFSDGLARVAVAGKWGFIDKAGTVVIRPQFEEADDFHDDRALVQISNRYGYIDRKGERVVQPQYEYAARFSNGMAMVRVGTSPNLKFGYIDKSGKVAIPTKFGDAGSFADGLAAVRIASSFGSDDKPEGKWGYIDTSGAYVIQPQFSFANEFSEGLALAAGADFSKLGYIDKTGKFVIPPQFDLRAGPFLGGIARVYSDRDYKTRDEHGYIDKTGRFLWKLRALEVKKP